MAAHLKNVHQPENLNVDAFSGPSGHSIPTSSGRLAPSTSSNVPTSSGSLPRDARFNILNNTLEEIQAQVNTATNTIVSVYDLLTTMFEYMTMSNSSTDEDNNSEHSDWEGF